jgi:hypothetical protein
MTNRSDRDPIPRVPFWLGAGGLIPFVVLTSALYALPGDYTPALVQWLLSYAAIILSFVGALHWGLAMLHPGMRDGDRNVSLAWSVVPALTAWAATLLQALPGMLLLAAAFTVHYAADRQLAQRFTLPSWYLPLRAGLTGVVVLCLILAAMHLARR